MKRVMFVQPWNYHDEGVVYHDLSQEWRNGPYNLLCLATQLKVKAIPVRIVDLQPVMVLQHGSVESCLERLSVEVAEFRPDIVGLSFFSYQFMEAKLIVDYAKEVCQKLNIRPTFITGGIHTSIEPKQTIRQLGVDYAFVGEGEIGVVDLAYGQTPDHVPGIVTMESQDIHKGVEVKDLDTLPFPDWSLCNFEFYTTPSNGKISLKASRTLDVMMGRGCVYRCAFCSYSTLSTPRFHSAEYLLEQIKLMSKLYGIDSVYFIDSSVGNNRRLLVQFCEGAIRTGLAKNIEWYANMRTNQVDESLLRHMWDAGCRALFYGFESGSQRILDLMNKKCTVEQNARAAEVHNKLRFPYHASIVLGYPGETETDIKLTFEFLRQVRPPSIGINWYVPLPGSDDYKRLKLERLIQVEDPREWRKLGEVLTSGRVYAAVAEDRFRQLFSYARRLASKIKAKDIGNWTGPVKSVVAKRGSNQFVHSSTMSESKDSHIGAIPPSNFFQFSKQVRQKWRELPTTRQGRIYSTDMLNWPDDRLLAHWEECRKQTCTPEVRRWYQNLYKDTFTDCDIADIGPGIGIDGIYFAQHGARVTFVDIVEDNLKLLERICRLKGINAEYYYIDDFFNYHFEHEFDVFMFIGSMHNAPFEFSQRQAEAMTPFLRVGGKIVMLAYPKERYLKLGARNFADFGKMTDGERTPWCEWYDDEKIKALFGPGFCLNWSRNFGKDGIEFNWFDLTKKEENEEYHTALSKFDHVGEWQNLRGEYLFIKGHFDESLKAFMRAIELDPGLASAHNNLGVFYFQQGDLTRARSHLGKAVEFDPDDRNIVLNWIKILIELGNIKDANEIYSDYLKRNSFDEEISRLLGHSQTPSYISINHEDSKINIPTVSVMDLHKELGLNTPIDYPQTSLMKPLTEWKMEIDDSPIFRYIYRNFRPRRHLEFGTWQGTGVVYCLEECDASVWTINLPFGENEKNGYPAYAHYAEELSSVREWAKKVGIPEKTTYRTDSIGFIGRFYLEKEFFLIPY